MDNRIQMLAATIHKLYKRSAHKNIQRIIEKTHKADIALILQSFPKYERLQLFRLITDKELRSEVVSYLDKEVQTELILELEPQEMQQTVSLMETDDAADVLSNLPEKVSSEILAKMDKEDSREVAGLMSYPEDSAGGLMSSDFLALREQQTVADAIREIQSKDQEDLVTFYLYVVNDTGHLIGVISLKQLLLSKPSEVLGKIMSRDVLTVSLETPQDEVARVVERYDFLCVPVVNSQNELMGVITVDDIIDVIREEGEEDILAMAGVNSSSSSGLWDQLKSRWPSLFMSFITGLAILFIIFSLSHKLGLYEDSPIAVFLMCFLPLLLSLGATTAHQAATVAAGNAKDQSLKGFELFKYIGKELQISSILALILALFAGLTCFLFFQNWLLTLVIFLSVVVQIVLAVLLASTVPHWMRRLSEDLIISSVIVVNMLVDIAAVLVLFDIAALFGLGQSVNL